MDDKRMRYRTPSGAATELVATKDAAWLAALHGLPAGRMGADPLAARGLAMFGLEIEGGQDESGFSLEDAKLGETEAELRFSFAASGLRYTALWSFGPESGMWRRRDTLSNTGRLAVVVRRLRSRVVLSMDRYELYTQESRWCGENQGSWQPLRHGSVTVSCDGARTCQGSSPVLGVRSLSSGRGLLFHLLPRGAWQMRASAVGAGLLENPYLDVEAGPSEIDLRIRLEPGSSWELPGLLIQELARGHETDGAGELHRYALEKLLPARGAAPLVYNTWFDAFDRLEPDRLERQLEAAAAIGCEILVVDAGWFGGTDESWAVLVGDWREKRNAAFKGRMREFAATVRSRGLGFGLWAEPERIRPAAPVFKEHPEWFLPASPPGSPNTDYYPDLANPAAYAYTLGEISRLIETYELAWIKLDYNHSPAGDPSGAAFSTFYDRLYRLLDELKARFPGTFFEGCASGGLRAELSTLAHHDCHFLTDTVDPVDVLRIGEGALIRLPPGRLAKWLTLRSVGRSIVRYGSTIEGSPESVVAPAGAVWEPAGTRHLRFLWAVTASGALGVSGDVAGLGAETRAELTSLLAAYKGIRDTVANGSAELLTTPRPRQDTTGWSALQISGSREKLLFAYRLDDGTEERAFPLRGLQPRAVYQISEVAASEAAARSSGAELMGEGLRVRIERRFDARVFSIRAS